MGAKQRPPEKRSISMPNDDIGEDALPKQSIKKKKKKDNDYNIEENHRYFNKLPSIHFPPSYLVASYHTQCFYGDLCRIHQQIIIHN